MKLGLRTFYAARVFSRVSCGLAGGQGGPPLPVHPQHHISLIATYDHPRLHGDVAARAQVCADQSHAGSSGRGGIQREAADGRHPIPRPDDQGSSAPFRVCWLRPVMSFTGVMAYRLQVFDEKDYKISLFESSVGKKIAKVHLDLSKCAGPSRSETMTLTMESKLSTKPVVKVRCCHGLAQCPFSLPQGHNRRSEA